MTDAAQATEGQGQSEGVATPAEATQGNNGATASVNQNGTQDAPVEMRNDNVPQWLPDRLEKAEKKGIENFLGELGLGGADELKAIVSDYQALKEAQMTEAEKRQQAEQDRLTEMETLKSENAKLLAQIEQANAVQVERQRSDVILQEFSQSPYAKDILRLIKDEYSADYESLLGDDGNVNDEIKAKLVKEISEKRGEWVRVSSSPGSPSASNRGYTAQQLSMTPDEIKKRASQARF